MTVVNAMIFNEESGALIADEQSSNHLRKYDVAEKVHVLGNSGVLGGTGRSDFLYEVIRTFDDEFSASKFNKHMNLFAWDKIRADFKGREGLSLEEFRANMQITPDGKQLPLQGPSYEAAQKTLDLLKEDYLSNGFLVMANENGALHLYGCDASRQSAQLIARPYCSIGSGADVGDHELSDFVSEIHPERRREIDPTKGLRALLYATRRAEKNQGVGGSSSLVIYNAGEITRPPKDSVRLAGELALAHSWRELQEECVCEMIEELLFKEADFSDVDAEFKKKAENTTRLERRLRGYRC